MEENFKMLYEKSKISKKEFSIIVFAMIWEKMKKIIKGGCYDRRSKKDV